MTPLDYVVLAIVGISVLIALWRGLVREVVALVGWIAALLIAIFASGMVADILPASWGGPAARYLIAFVLLFVLTLMLAALIGWLLSRLLRAVGLGFLDRLLGAVFGLARGLLIVMVLVLLAGLTSLPQRDWWRGAALAMPLETAAMALRPYLPDGLAKQLHYPGDQRARSNATRKS
jgi:membrane protein required for colicin V production